MREYKKCGWRTGKTWYHHLGEGTAGWADRAKGRKSQGELEESRIKRSSNKPGCVLDETEL